MIDLWVPVRDIPPAGKEYVLDNQESWAEPLKEFSLACRVISPLRAELFVLPQEDGAFVQGTITGTVSLPCDRCMEDSEVVVHHSFKSFEPFPSMYGEEESEDLEIDQEVVRLTRDKRGIEMNLAALAWEEFSLFLPVKPLCNSACKGLCPSCGVNRNLTACTCVVDTGDPRLAVLRGLTVNR